MAEVSFHSEIKSLTLGKGDTFRGEGILGIVPAGDLKAHCDVTHAEGDGEGRGDTAKESTRRRISESTASPRGRKSAGTA